MFSHLAEEVHKSRTPLPGVRHRISEKGADVTYGGRRVDVVGSLAGKDFVRRDSQGPPVHREAVAYTHVHHTREYLWCWKSGGSISWMKCERMSSKT